MAQKLDVSTDLDAGKALARARAAIEGIGSVGTIRVRITGEADDGFEVTLKATVIGWLADDTAFVVQVAADGPTTSVHAEISSYSVYQQKIFMFIPFGPKTVPGINVYKRCIGELEKAFAA